MSNSFNNWFIIYPYENKNKIKEEFEKLRLKEFTVGIIIINDNLSEKEEDEYVNFCNKNLKYSGYINTSSEKKLTETIEIMGGIKNDDLYIFKEGKIIHKRI